MITVRDALAAMKKDGLPKIKNNYFKAGFRNYVFPDEIRTLSKKKIDGACAAGQCAYNLNAVKAVANIEEQLNNILFKAGELDVNLKTGYGYHSVNHINDESDLTVPEIADVLFKRAEELEVLDRELFI